MAVYLTGGLLWPSLCCGHYQRVTALRVSAPFRKFALRLVLQAEALAYAAQIRTAQKKAPEPPVYRDPVKRDPFRAVGRPTLESPVHTPSPVKPLGVSDEEWFDAERPEWQTWKDLRDSPGIATQAPGGGHGPMGAMPQDAIDEYLNDLKVSPSHFNPAVAPPRRTFKEFSGLTPQSWPELPSATSKASQPAIEAFMNSDIGQKNIEKVLSYATPEEKEYWTRWYPGAHALAWKLAKKFDQPLNIVAGVLAVLSPRTDWINNVGFASAALAGNWEEVRTISPENERKAWSLINEGDFSVIRGDKVHKFFQSIYDPQRFENEVVVDTHAAAIWLGRRVGEIPSISPTVRAKMTEDYRNAAKTFGITPQGAQALAWVLWRGLEEMESGEARGQKVTREKHMDTVRGLEAQRQAPVTRYSFAQARTARG